MQLNRIWRAVAFTLSNLNKFPCCPVCSAILSLLRLDYILSPFLFPLILSFPILFSLDDSLQNTMIICAKRRSLVCCGKGGKVYGPFPRFPQLSIPLDSIKSDKVAFSLSGDLHGKDSSTSLRQISSRKVLLCLVPMSAFA